MAGRTLLLIDIQRDYFPGGAMPLHEPEAAAEAAAGLLQRFRDAGERVVHVAHAGTPEGGFLVADTPGAEIHDAVAPADGEPVVTKPAPNAFLGTDLHERLQADGAESLVVAGMMTSMCVDATVRAAADLGYDVTVVGDACACPGLEHDGRSVAAPDVHAAFLAALGSAYATVVTADDLSAA